MDDVDENAHLVNALQRHATVVVQKSLVEGFGLTVTEPMWKGRPVVASARRRHPGPDRGRRQRRAARRPPDLDAFAALAADLSGTPNVGQRLGAAAHERVQ